MNKQQIGMYRRKFDMMAEGLDIDIRYKKNSVVISTSLNKVSMSYQQAEQYLRRIKSSKDTRSSYYG